MATLPKRLRPYLLVSETFGTALRNALGATPPERRRGPGGFVDISSIGRIPDRKKTVGFFVPKPCHELCIAWQKKGGELAHLSLETVARLAVDVYLDEVAPYLNVTTPFSRTLYQARDPAPLIAAGYKPVNGKQAGPMFWLTDAEAQQFSGALVLLSSAGVAPAPAR